MQRGSDTQRMHAETFPNQLKTQEMCEMAVHREPNSLEHAQEMCNKAVREGPYSLRFVPGHFKTQEMDDTAVRVNPTAFFLVPDHF